MLPYQLAYYVMPICFPYHINLFTHILLSYRFIYTYFLVILICLHIFIGPFLFPNIGFLCLLAHIQILKCNFHFLRIPTLIDPMPPISSSISRNELTKNVKPIKKNCDILIQVVFFKTYNTSFHGWWHVNGNTLRCNSFRHIWRSIIA